jgi:hypothetical protein
MSMSRRWRRPANGTGPRAHETPPDAFDWSSYGRTDRVVAGEAGVGHETPPEFVGWMRGLGERDGAAGLPDELTTKKSAPPLEIAANGAKVRIGVAKQALMRKVAPLQEKIKRAPSLIKALKGKVTFLELELEFQLTALKKASGLLEPLRLNVEQGKERLTNAQDGFSQLSRSARGYFATFLPVGLTDGGVVLFDVAVLHGALATSGLPPATEWMTSVTVPLAVAASNHAFGVLLGAIGLRLPSRHRFKAATAWFVAGFGALIVAFLLLMIFRAEATNAINAGLTAVASGRTDAKLSFFIPLWWLGPLQIAGSFAAVTLTALWTMAKKGREYRRDVIKPAEDGLAAAQAELEEAESQVGELEQTGERIREAIETTRQEESELEAEASGAQAQVDSLTKEFLAVVNTEEALGDEAAAVYKTERNYVAATYTNGGVWRAQKPTQWGRRPYTPAPSDELIPEEQVRARYRQGQESSSEAPLSDEAPSNNHSGDRPIDPSSIKSV